MKNHFILYLIVAVCGLCSYTLSEEFKNAEDELIKINEYYSNHHSVYHEFEYNLYSSAETKEIHSTEKGSALISEDISYAKLGFIESISKADFTVATDHDEKIVIISNVVNPSGQSPSELIDGFVELASGTSVEMLDNGLSKIECIMEYGQVEKSQIIYNSQSYEIHKIISFYRNEMPLDIENEEDESSWTKPRLEVNYTFTSTKGEKDQLLDFERIVKNENGVWKLAKAYEGYELLNNILELDSTK